MRDLGLIPGLERSPGRGHNNPLQYSCLENPHEQRSLAGYSPWGCKELDRTEGLNTTEHSDLDFPYHGDSKISDFGVGLRKIKDTCLAQFGELDCP